MRRLLLGLAACGLLSSTATTAYEVDTHAEITRVAFERSVLGNADAAIWALLGLDRLEGSAPFRSWYGPAALRQRDPYMDLTGSWQPQDEIPAAHIRFAHVYEADRFTRFLNYIQPHLAPQAWLMRGAIREDDLKPVEYRHPPRPDPDPYGDIARSLHHFYDPVGNSTFPSLPGVVAPVRSIDWALGVENALSPSFNPLLSRRNHFSWVDARRQLWLAITYKPSPGASEADGRAAQLRQAFLASAFKSLGQVLHHVQDAAQPQHSRKDAHTHSYDWYAFLANASVTRRTFEVWTNHRISRAADVRRPFVGPEEEGDTFSNLFGGEPALARRPIPLSSSYPIPKFATPVEFFTTRHLDSDILARRGLADYSNRGFFSEGTVPRPFSGFAHPPDALDNPGYEVSERIERLSDGRTVRFRELTRLVPDAFAPASAQRLALGEVGVFHTLREGVPIYVGAITLAQYANQADNLIPRAVAYSAGLIDHFFRGRLEVRAPAHGLVALLDHAVPHYTDAEGYPRRLQDGRVYGFETVRLRVRNDSRYFDEAPVESLAGGELVAVAEYHRNLCYEPDLSREPVRVWPTAQVIPGDCPPGMSRSVFPEISVSAPVAVAGNLDGSLQPVSFDFSADPVPINATDLILRLVYRGHLGAEPQVGLAVGMLDVSEPSYFSQLNTMDYAWWSGQWWRPEVLEEQSQFSGDPEPLPLNDIAVSVAGSVVYTATGVDVERFVRLAGVFGPGIEPVLRVQMRFGTNNLSSYQQPWTVGIRQADRARLAPGTPYTPAPILRFRGLPAGDAFRWAFLGFSTPPPSNTSYLDLDPLTPQHAGLYLPEPGSSAHPPPH